MRLTFPDIAISSTPNRKPEYVKGNQMATSPITVAVLGAGGRGIGFGDLVAGFPEWAKVVAVAEPRQEYRESFAEKHGLADDMVFETWEDFVARPKLCDAVVISTMDQDHVGPAVACTRMGCHMLLEKPMAVTLADCRAIAEAQQKAGTTTAVCHSMRYHKAFRMLKELADAGRFGRVVSIDQLEQVMWWHQAHSFVRGNWGNEGRSTFMLLAKSCHDLDYIAYLTGEPCLRVSSFGSLTYFTSENAPAGSGERCTDCGVERDCAYSAIKHYVEADREKWPASAVSHAHDEASHRRAIETGRYGRCVWKCDNDVVDHQVVAMEFANGVTATFTMTAFAANGGRLVRVHGTEGEAHMQEDRIVVRNFADNAEEVIDIPAETGGHGGGDYRVVKSWLQALVENDPSQVVTDVHESLRTHSIVFAAERSRLENRTITMSEIYDD